MWNGQFLSSTEIHEVPEKPGVYSWYLNIGFKKDQPTFSDLQKFISKRHNFIDPLTVGVLKSAERFGSVTTATLKTESRYSHPNAGDELSHEIVKWALQEGDGEGTNADMRSVLEGTSAVVLIRDLLRDTFPAFSSPLYIGTSKNLQVRLGEHIALYQRLEASDLHVDPDEHSPPWMTFAHRAWSHGIRLSDLRYTFAEFPESHVGLTGEQLTSVRLFCEKYLNLLARPVFGMR